jgi:hypothetical protein
MVSLPAFQDCDEKGWRRALQDRFQEKWGGDLKRSNLVILRVFNAFGRLGFR